MLEFLSNFEQNLEQFATAWGTWIYLFVGLNIYAETGLVVAAFLPGDSLLFACGVLCSREDANLSFPVFVAVFWAAAILGNYTNFLIARFLCVRIAGKPGIEGAGEAVSKVWGGVFSKIIRPQDLHKADAFFRKWGVLAVGVARFLPFFRTFIPFVAGVSDMTQSKFLLASTIGGFIWALVVTGVGYFAGNIPWVKDNFTLFIGIMFAVGFTPIAFGALRNYLKNRGKASADLGSQTGDSVVQKPAMPEDPASSNKVN